MAYISVIYFNTFLLNVIILILIEKWILILFQIPIKYLNNYEW